MVCRRRRPRSVSVITVMTHGAQQSYIGLLCQLQPTGNFLCGATIMTCRFFLEIYPYSDYGAEHRPPKRNDGNSCVHIGYVLDSPQLGGSAGSDMVPRRELHATSPSSALWRDSSRCSAAASSSTASWPASHTAHHIGEELRVSSRWTGSPHLPHSG